MSRFNKYNNIFDEHDDGADLAVTAEDEAAADDQGREEAGAYIATAAKVGGSGKMNADHRRMWVRKANKALAEGRQRRVKAASDEKAARVAAAKTAARKAENEEKAKRSRESIGRFCIEFDERWARIDEETREMNAEWAAGKEGREAAAERAQEAEVRPEPMQVATQRPSEVRPLQGPASPAATNPQAATAALPTRIPAASAQANRMMSEPRPVRTAPTCQTSPRSPEPIRPPSQTPPATRTSPTAELARQPAKPLRLEPQRRVAPASTQPAWAPPAASWPPLSASTTAPAGPSLGRPAAAPLPVVVSRSTRPALPVPARVLTGADLAGWRAARGLAQRPAADLLGVAPSTVAKAELLPGKVLGDQLQVALAVALGP